MHGRPWLEFYTETDSGRLQSERCESGSRRWISRDRGRNSAAGTTIADCGMVPCTATGNQSMESHFLTIFFRLAEGSRLTRSEEHTSERRVGKECRSRW